MTGAKGRLAAPALALAAALLWSAGALAADDLPPAPAAAAAHLSRDRVAASADAQAMLTVDAPGRFAISAASPTGVALQLVDMIAGPGEVVGQAGARDGRLDVLLDKGTYKIRTFGAVGATGDARLAARPFHEAGAASAALLRGGETSTELEDLGQRSYWILVDKSGALYVEAAGRALADLRVWRNGTDLVAIDPVVSTIEPSTGHPLLRARIEGHVEPGLYLASLYGGEPLPWADGAKAQPLHVRAGAAPLLVGSATDAVIGPFGSARFVLPPPPAAGPSGYRLQPPQAVVRLELREPAPVRLTARRGGAAEASAAIARNSREPLAALSVPGNAGEPARVDVTGAQGQAFRLRVLRPVTTFRAAAAGPHLVAVAVAGEGGDELPASVVLAAFDQKNQASSLVSTAPRIGPGLAWRRRFNLRGATDLLFEVTGAGPLAVRAQGPQVAVTLENMLGGRAAPRADGRPAPVFDLEPGWYRLRLAPANDAAGMLDLTFGPPDLDPEVAPPSPPRSAIALGTFDLDPAERYQLFTDVAPGLVAALDARALPLQLAPSPVAIMQGSRSGPAAPALDIPVRVPAGGAIAATDMAGRPVAITTTNETAGPDGRTLTVRIPAADRAREIALVWSGGAVADPLPRIAPEQREALTAAKPRFFDLKADQQREFLLDVPEGGLYRIETLGRLKTSATVATAFLPNLSTADDNGAGHNALLQTYLRSGQYRVRVAVSESAGHLGVVASPAPLVAAGPLPVDGSARASLAEGRGAAFAFDIAEAGRYRLELYGLGDTPTARLEDSEGWPLTVPGGLRRLEQNFTAGRYRLVVLPEPVDTRVVARLIRLVDPVEPQGHGPHPLPFDAVQKFQWREPVAKDAERVPDRWEFALAGETNIVLEVSDGMIADLVSIAGDAPRVVSKLVYTRGFSGRLPAGRYAVEARALGRNDRLDYELTLRSSEVQPGTPRFVGLPATIPFAIAQDRVVSLTTFGRSELAGVLKDQNGQVIERLGPRSDDWNLALSRRLRAGAYRLELAKVSADVAAAADAADDEPAQPAEEAPAEEQPDEDNTGTPDPGRGARIEIRFDLPDGAQVREVPLPPAAAGDLVVVAAESRSELVVSLERENADHTFVPVGVERGRSAAVAALADGDDKRRWRASVWRVDGGAAAIAVAARTVSAPVQALGPVALAPVQLDGITLPVRVAQVATPSAALVSLAGSAPDLRLGSASGRALVEGADGLFAPQSEHLWLLDRGDAAPPVSLRAVPAAPGELALSLAGGERAVVKSGPVAAGRLRAWRVDSTLGQPGLSAGGSTGIADASALSIGTSDTATAWNASGGEPLQVRVASADIAPRPPLTIDAQFAAVLAPHSAQPLVLPPGGRQIEVGLAAGTAALIGTASPRPITVWSGRAAVSRQVVGNFADLLLVNPGDRPAAVSVALSPAAGEAGRLAIGQAMKRFFGAAGSLSLLVDAAAGDRLTVAGASATFVDQSGGVQRGASLVVSGPGELVLDHPVGLVAAWLERDGASPWPVAAARALAPPQSVTLAGDAMTFALAQDTPVLLHARTTAPVILALDAGQNRELRPFPAGAEFYRYVPAGEASLRLYSPHDGPLAGSLTLTATPVTPIAEGLGDERTLAPGATALFGFELTRAADIGVGIRSEPDRATARLLDAAGRSLGDGVTQLHRLPPGRYLLEARVPADGGAVIARPALIGITPRPSGPPPEIARQYLEMVGLTPGAPRAGRAK